MNQVIDDVWNWLKHVLAVAVPSIALVWAFLKWFGQKWIEGFLNKDLEKFKREQQEKLEAVKIEQQKELERLRHLLTSRISKIHERNLRYFQKRG